MMQWWCKFLIVAVVAGCWPANGFARLTGNELVHASIYADGKGLAAGVPFTVGVLLKIEPGYHIYWINPGESGLATRVKLKLPEGMEAGPTMFPVPTRLSHTGDVAIYGYEGEVMLMTRVTPSGRGPAVGVVGEISARVSWLVCKDVCLPGKAALTLSLPAVEKGEPANEELFKKWSRLVPQESPTELVSERVLAGEKPGERVIEIRWKSAAYKATDLFPEPSESVAVDDVRIVNGDMRSTILLSPRLLVGQKAPSEPLPVVIAFSNGEGERLGVTVRLNLSDVGSSGATSAVARP